MAVHALFPGHVFSGSVLDQLKSACGRRTAHPWATPAMLSSPLVISAYWQDERKAVGGNVREEAGGKSGFEDRKRLASRLGRARERTPGRLQNTSTAESVHFLSLSPLSASGACGSVRTRLRHVKEAFRGCPCGCRTPHGANQGGIDRCQI